MTLLASDVQHNIKDGNSLSTLALPDLAGDVYQSRLSTISRVFAKESFLIYKFEEACKDTFGPVGHFLRQIGVPEEKLGDFEYSHSNSSMSDNAVEILNYINEKYPLTNTAQEMYGRHVSDTFLFQRLCGNKFNFSQRLLLQVIEKARPDKQWLFDNFDVDYRDVDTVTIRKDLPTEHSYTQQYFDQLFAAVRHTSNSIKYILHQFCTAKTKEDLDDNTKASFDRLCSKLLQRYPDLLAFETLEQAHQYTQKQVRDSYAEQKQMLAKLGVDNMPHPADFYREMATFCEQQGQIETAYHFMCIARLHRSFGPVIVRKCEEYFKAIASHQI